MSQGRNSLSQVLKNHKIISQAPGRVDLGGGIDHRIISLLCHENKLATFNIAVKLYTRITLESYIPGRILINSDKIGSKEFISNTPYFNDKFALVLAIASFFRVDGVKISINTEFPPISGLGGSGSLSVALISAFVKALNLKYSLKKIVWLAHSIEDSLFKNTGLQDQAAACFGGINLFNWKYQDSPTIFTQTKFSHSKIDFEKKSLIVYSGCPHYLTRRGSRIIHSFLNQPNGFEFVKNVDKNTSKFICAFKKGDLVTMKQCLDYEENLRKDFLKYRIPSTSSKIISVARKNNCGIKFVGGGGGGCLWVLGDEENIKKLKEEISCINSILILPFQIDTQGVKTSHV